MAELQSEEENCPSSLKIFALDLKALPGEGSEKQQWQNVRFELTSGKRVLQTVENEDSVLCRTPTDEVLLLAQHIEQILEKQSDQLRFEPSEPSFEILIERTRRGGIKVEVWLDAGNGTTAIFTWDAAGVRFYTTDEKLRAFLDQLKSDFQLP